MDFDLTKMNWEFLNDTRSIQFSKLVDLQLENDEKKKDQIKRLKTFVEKLDAEVQRRTEEGEKKEDQKKVKTEGFAKDFTSHKIKSMSHVIASEVPVFSSGHDVHTWLNKLDSYYKLYVANDNSGVMEEHFVQNAKSRLCPEYLHSMLANSETTDTFAKMTEYMKKNHASKMSVFQILDTLWEMNQTESESFRDYGIRLDDKAAEAENIIVAKFKEWKMSKNETSPMTLSDAFKLVSGQVFLQNLKNKEQTIYNSICNDLDKTWSAREIALKAMTYSDRMSTSNESRNQTIVTDAFVAQAPVKNCQFYLKGHCRFGNDCRSLHDEGLRDLFKIRINKSESKKDEENDKKSKNELSRKREKAESEKPTSYTAVVGTEDWPIPVVPLPTQNFRC